MGDLSTCYCLPSQWFGLDLIPLACRQDYQKTVNDGGEGESKSLLKSVRICRLSLLGLNAAHVSYSTNPIFYK